MKQLRQITVIGLGLLGGSVALASLRSLSGVKTVGYSHRPVTRRKAKRLGVAEEIFEDINESVSAADIVILATPICTFESTFGRIADSLRAGCIVTDVGSTKVLPHQWAKKELPKQVHYVGSHPIAGSEKRGVEFARDDLFDGAVCILTTTNRTNNNAVQVLKKFWAALGCSVKLMRPDQHDEVFANVSHLPHMLAAALMNASNLEDLKFTGKGFIDTSRVASGPANIWADILATNTNNTSRSIDRIIKELLRLQKAIKSGNKKQIEKLLAKASSKRAALIKQKIKSKEIIL